MEWDWRCFRGGFPFCGICHSFLYVWIFLHKKFASPLPSASEQSLLSVSIGDFGAELIEDDVGEYILFTTRMIVRLGITWILPAMYPQMGDSPAYTLMLFSWSVLGVFRNFQRSWRRTRVIGGWESESLSLYISLVALRYIDSPCSPSLLESRSQVSHSWFASLITVDNRAIMYYALYPLGSLCESWILFRILSQVGMLSRIIIVIVTIVNLGGMFFRFLEVRMTVVAGWDVFVRKWRNIIIEPKYMAWIPVDDGSQGFWSLWILLRRVAWDFALRCFRWLLPWYLTRRDDCMASLWFIGIWLHWFVALD